MDRLVDWFGHLLAAKKVLSKSPLAVAGQAAKEPESSIFRILRMIMRCQALLKYAAIKSNFLHAAMHLACMIECSFPAGMPPDLPCSIDQLHNGCVSPFFTVSLTRV